MKVENGWAKRLGSKVKSRSKNRDKRREPIGVLLHREFA
jgi:hypothetical protein